MGFALRGEVQPTRRVARSAALNDNIVAVGGIEADEVRVSVERTRLGPEQKRADKSSFDRAFGF